MHGLRQVQLGGEGGGTIAVHDLGGDGDGRGSEGSGGRAEEFGPLLFVHATGLHGRVWAPLVAQLTPALRNRAMAMDVRGHGESAPLPEGGLAWEDLAADVLAVVDGLHLQRPRGVGHSAGASLLLLAEELRPGTFAGLYCIEPIGTAADEAPPPNPAHPLAEGARRRRKVFPSRQAAFDTYSSKPPFSHVSPDALRSYVEHGFADVTGTEAEAEERGVRLKCSPEAEAAMYAHGLSHHAFRDLGRVNCPVTVAGGDRSIAVSADTLALWVARLGDARLEMLAGVGHFAPLEDPPAVARAVTAALP